MTTPEVVRATCPARAIAMAVLLVSGLLAATPTAADDFRDALVGLKDHIDDPAQCSPGAACERSYPKASQALAGAIAEIDAGDPSKGLSRASTAFKALERGEVPGPLALLLDGALDTAFSAVGNGGELAHAAVDGLCSSMRLKGERGLTKPDEAYAEVPALLLASQWSRASKSLVKIWSTYSKAETRVDKDKLKCQPKICRDDTPVVFTPGTGECLSLVPADKGTSVCYRVDADELFGDLICFEFTGLGRYTASATISDSECGEIDVTGKISASSCTDSAGWIRISKLAQKLKARSEFCGSQSAGASLSSQPGSVSFFGGLFPSAAGALRLCVGDVMEEPMVESTLKLFGESILQNCTDLRHEVVEVRGGLAVEAGTFPAALVQSTGDCQVELDLGDGFPFIENFSLAVETWVASELGPLRIEVRENGVLSIDYELASEARP